MGEEVAIAGVPLPSFIQEASVCLLLRVNRAGLP